MLVLWLLHLRFSRQDCSVIVNCSPNAITNYIHTYNTGGLEAIRELNYGRVQHSLCDRFDEVKDALADIYCPTIQHARSVLEEKFSYRGGKEATRQLPIDWVCAS
jgi:hypothetical protein